MVIVKGNLKNRSMKASEVSRSAMVTRKATDCRFDSYPRKEKYLVVLFLRSGVEARRGVEFRHSTCNASRIQGTECQRKPSVNTRFPLPTLLCAKYSLML